MKKILFIDDDEVTHKLVQHSLGTDYQVIPCYTLAEANGILDTVKNLAAVIIDRKLPDGDGLTICSRIRQEVQFHNLPIIFLSGADAEIDKVGAFFAGADDYVTKPFGLLELKARIQARLRNSLKKISAGNIEVDLDSQRAQFKGPKGHETIELTRIEFKILATFIQSIEQVFSREGLLLKVWGSECNVSDRVVDSHISHLRKKISHTGIILESLRGEGYRMSLSPVKLDQPA